MPLVFILIMGLTVGLFEYATIYGPDSGSQIAGIDGAFDGPGGDFGDFSADYNDGKGDTGGGAGPAGGSGYGGGVSVDSSGSVGGGASGESGPDCGNCGGGSGSIGSDYAGDPRGDPSAGYGVTPGGNSGYGIAGPTGYSSQGVIDSAINAAQFGPEGGLIGINDLSGWADFDAINKSISDKTQNHQITSSGQLNPGTIGVGSGYSTPSTLNEQERKDLVEKYGLQPTGQREFMGTHGRNVYDANQNVREAADKIAQAYIDGIPHNRVSLMALDYTVAKAAAALAELQAQKFYNNSAVTDDELKQASDNADLLADASEIAKETFDSSNAEEFDDFVEGVLDMADKLGYLDQLEDDISRAVRDLPGSAFDPRDWANTFNVSPPEVNPVDEASQQLAKTMYDFFGITPPNYKGNIDDDYITKTNETPVPTLGNLARADFERQKMSDEAYIKAETAITNGLISDLFPEHSIISLAAKTEQYMEVISFADAVNKASIADAVYKSEIVDAAHKFGEVFKSGSLPQSDNIEFRSDELSEIDKLINDVINGWATTRGSSVTDLAGAEIQASQSEITSQLEALADKAQSINQEVQKSIANGDLTAAEKGLSDLKSLAEMSAISLGQAINSGVLSSDAWGKVIDRTFDSIVDRVALDNALEAMFGDLSTYSEDQAYDEPGDTGPR